MPTVMRATDVRIHFGEVMQRVVQEGEPIIVERAGQPQVAVVSMEDYNRLKRIKVQRDTLAALERARAARARVRQERGGELLPDVTDILHEVREARGAQLTGLH